LGYFVSCNHLLTWVAWQALQSGAAEGLQAVPGALAAVSQTWGPSTATTHVAVGLQPHGDVLPVW